LTRLPVTTGEWVGVEADGYAIVILDWALDEKSAIFYSVGLMSRRFNTTSKRSSWANSRPTGAVGSTNRLRSLIDDWAGDTNA